MWASSKPSRRRPGPRSPRHQALPVAHAGPQALAQHSGRGMLPAVAQLLLHVPLPGLAGPGAQDVHPLLHLGSAGRKTGKREPQALKTWLGHGAHTLLHDPVILPCLFRHPCFRGPCGGGWRAAGGRVPGHPTPRSSLVRHSGAASVCPRQSFSFGGHGAMSGHVSGCRYLVGAALWWGETKDTANPPAMSSLAPETQARWLEGGQISRRGFHSGFPTLLLCGLRTTNNLSGPRVSLYKESAPRTEHRYVRTHRKRLKQCEVYNKHLINVS